MPVTSMTQHSAPTAAPGTFDGTDSEFYKDVITMAKWKARSEETHKKTHKPELITRAKAEEQIDVVLVGSSMFERFKDTGATTRVGRLPKRFNAGVGGDKIPSVLYQCQLGLLKELAKFKPKLWVLSIGTNDLRENRPFRRKDIDGYKLLLQAMIRATPGSRIISTAISYRRDIEDWVVDESIFGIKRVGEELDEEFGGKMVVRWPQAPGKAEKGKHQVDHVHDNKEGYRIWDGVLFPAVEEMMKMGSWNEAGEPSK